MTYMLPSTLTLIGIAFLILWRWQVRASLFWSAGFLLWAAGQTLVAIGSHPYSTRFYAAGLAAFIMSLFFQMHGLQVRVGKPRHWLSGRIGLCMAAIALIVFSLRTPDDRWLEHATNLATRLALTGIALWTMYPKLGRAIDKLLFSVVILMTLQVSIAAALLIHASLPVHTGETPAGFFVAMEMIGSVIAIMFALAAFAASADDLMSGYRDASVRDPMTRLLNRRGLEAAIEHQGDHWAGTLILLDIDRFKRINDTFGHAMAIARLGSSRISSARNAIRT